MLQNIKFNIFNNKNYRFNLIIETIDLNSAVISNLYFTKIQK